MQFRSSITLVVEQLIKAYLGLARSDTIGLLSVDLETGDVVIIGDGCTTVAEAIEVAKADFWKFAGTCEQECGEPPTNLYHQAEFVVGPDGIGAVITFRAPEPGESKFPVMCVQEGHAHMKVTVEGLSSATPAPAPSAS